MDPRKKLERQMLKGFLKEFPSVTDERAEEILTLVYDEDGGANDGTQIPVVGEDEEPKTPNDMQDDSPLDEVKQDAERMLDEKIAELEEEQENEPDIDGFDDALEQMKKENEEYKRQAEEHFENEDDSEEQP